MAAIRLAISQFRPAKGDYAGNVERIGGTIDVRSEPGRGTTFEVRLPAETPGPA